MKNSDNLANVIRHIFEMADKYNVDESAKENLGDAVVKLQSKFQTRLQILENQKAFSSKNKRRHLRAQIAEAAKIESSLRKLLYE